MARLGRTLEEYTKHGGWSSHHFAGHAVRLIQWLYENDADVKIGRHVIHVKKGDVKFKAYPHYKGRSEEYVTITTMRGEELLTVHYTEFEKLEAYVKHHLSSPQLEAL